MTDKVPLLDEDREANDIEDYPRLDNEEKVQEAPADANGEVVDG